MTIDLTANPNTHSAAEFINELVLAGLEAMCFAPGSRSTPLVLAAHANPTLTLYRHLDERSAGFFALGLAKASGRPVAIVCTSGTAVANLYPAVIEAFESHVPLIVLSADRPPELRGSGANQTIDQLKIFGDHVRLFVEMPVPQTDTPEIVSRHLRTMAARVYACAAGSPSGPVHVNFPFRKPLEPSITPTAPALSQERSDLPSRAFTSASRGDLVPSAIQIDWLTDLIMREPHGLIVCGPNCPGGDFAASVTELSRKTGYPLVADPLSGVRHGSHIDKQAPLGGYDLLLQAAPFSWPRARAIIRFGDVPTSAALNAYVERCAPEDYLHVRGDGVWADDLHLVRHFWQIDEGPLLQMVLGRLGAQDSRRQDQAWANRFEHLEQLVWDAQSNFMSQTSLYDGSAVRSVLATLTSGTSLLVGNSLPTRHVDAYDRPCRKKIAMYGNRGASGIDGNVSTAIGIACAQPGPVLALLGDITFYHDMNGLLALGQPGVPPVNFVVLNNDGGGIFRRLPISAAEPPFNDLFLTPHGLTFEHAAALYGLAYHRILDTAELNQTLATMVNTADVAPTNYQSHLIEILTDGPSDLRLHRALIDQIANAVAFFNDGAASDPSTEHTLEPGTQPAIDLQGENK